MYLNLQSTLFISFICTRENDLEMMHRRCNTNDQSLGLKKEKKKDIKKVKERTKKSEKNIWPRGRTPTPAPTPRFADTLF